MYTQDAFDRILQDGFNYNIESSTHDIIHDLAAAVGAPDYIRTPVFSSSTTHRERSRGPRQRRRNQEITDDDWEGIRVFQTKEKQPESPIDLARKRFRELLNRITRSHVSNETVDEITLCISEAVVSGDGMSDQVLLVLADMISGNAMNSAAYAELVVRLLDSDDYDVAEAVYNLIFARVAKWQESFKDIVEVSEDDDFDKFCENNRLNDVRKTWSSFFGYLVSLISGRLVESISGAVYDIVVSITEKLGDKKNMYECEQMGFSMIALFDAMESPEKLVTTSNETPICEMLKDISSSGTSATYPGLSNKLLFKLMDFNP